MVNRHIVANNQTRLIKQQPNHVPFVWYALYQEINGKISDKQVDL